MSQRPEIISLLGTAHYDRPATGEELSRLERDLAEALTALGEEPDRVESHVMYGRRLAYLWRYCEAIAVFSDALDRFGDDASLYRHRGHRYISVRRFGPAVRDLGRAFELEPEDFDICYHLGLARWFLGDWAGAREVYRGFLPRCEDAEQQVAMGYWLYMTLRRLDQDAEAKAVLDELGTPEGVSESASYLDLLRLFRGDLIESDILKSARENPLAASTLGFGLGCRYLFEGCPDEASECFLTVTRGSHWPAFGFIGAEVELARLRGMLAP
ncbi:MAG: tetratricopeptide repeat protein [Bacillota bacterium]